jgi:hypothetical protein
MLKHAVTRDTLLASTLALPCGVSRNAEMQSGPKLRLRAVLE